MGLTSTSVSNLTLFLSRFCWVGVASDMLERRTERVEGDERTGEGDRESIDRVAGSCP